MTAAFDSHMMFADPKLQFCYYLPTRVLLVFHWTTEVEMGRFDPVNTFEFYAF